MWSVHLQPAEQCVTFDFVDRAGLRGQVIPRPTIIEQWVIGKPTGIPRRPSGSQVSTSVPDLKDIPVATHPEVECHTGSGYVLS